MRNFRGSIFLLIFFASQPWAWTAGDDLGQMKEFIRQAFRRLQLTPPADTQGLAREIHDSISRIKPRGAKVSLSDVLLEVEGRRSSFERGPGWNGKRGRPKGFGGRAMGLAGVSVVIVGTVARGEAPGMQEIAETALGFVPVVGPIYSTYVVADEVIAQQRDALLQAYAGNTLLEKDLELLQWQVSYSMLESALLEYNQEQRYPWQGSPSADPSQGRWRDVATINMNRVAYCANRLLEILHSRHIIRDSNRESSRQIIRRSVDGVYDDCIHNRGEYASTNPAERTFQPRDPRTAPLINDAVPHSRHGNGEPSVGRPEADGHL